jgi:iron complex transport system substrate-binding protein
MTASHPERIVCLTEETTETLYLLGEGHRVVGISGYTVRPSEARQKPKVSAFTSARFEKIEALEPDLVLAFSDLQADIVSELVKRGYPVFLFNQRSVSEILQMIRVLGGIVGCQSRADELAAGLASGLEAIRRAAASWRQRPRVFFEEWDSPLISGICWVDELIELAGGSPLYPELRDARLAKDRIRTLEDVARRDPDVVIASWCGKPVRKERILARAEWQSVPAVRNGHIYEIKSTYILQPGPAALTEGVRQLHAILAHVLDQRVDDALRPTERVDAALAAGGSALTRDRGTRPTYESM